MGLFQSFSSATAAAGGATATATLKPVEQVLAQRAIHDDAMRLSVLLTSLSVGGGPVGERRSLALAGYVQAYFRSVRGFGVSVSGMARCEDLAVRYGFDPAGTVRELAAAMRAVCEPLGDAAGFAESGGWELEPWTVAWLARRAGEAERERLGARVDRTQCEAYVRQEALVFGGGAGRG
ncbi:hypothetical protein ABT160_26770 [Streptomyces sp. NPDC001941]|uniref:hypothetical protein n=1 Tax=Streptomyces sp. NPDC001941 TaxID=3154659 RepID=UPI00331F02CD